MNENNQHLKFINLRIKGFTLVKAAEILGVSVITAKRWNKALKDEIVFSKKEESAEIRKKIISKYQSYIDYLDSHFKKIQREIQNHENIFMPYDKMLFTSLKIIESINKIESFKTSISDTNDSLLFQSLEDSVELSEDESIEESVDDSTKESEIVSAEKLNENSNDNLEIDITNNTISDSETAGKIVIPDEDTNTGKSMNKKIQNDSVKTQQNKTDGDTRNDTKNDTKGIIANKRKNQQLNTT
jgi:hypothetical protein